MADSLIERLLESIRNSPGSRWSPSDEVRSEASASAEWVATVQQTPLVRKTPSARKTPPAQFL